MARSWQRQLLFASGLALANAGALFACGPPSGAGGSKPKTDQSIIMVATERSSGGGRLVGVRADGARQYELTDVGGEEPIIDRSPSLSPDGKVVVFASNRGRDDISATGLWWVSVEGGRAKPLSDNAAMYRDPRFSPDGRWLYFCSNRQGTFDLYRAPFRAGALGELQVVAQSEQEILSPSLSPDGTMVVYMAVDDEGHSRLWRTSTGGQEPPTMLTEGPMDMTPAWGADGTPDGIIAFASRAPGRDDADLFLMPAQGGERKALVSTPLTDETGPRFSDDARFIFAIGMYRNDAGQPILGSIIFVDRQEAVPHYRALHDPAAVESRIGLALLPDAITPARLHENPSYKEALKKVIMQEWLRNERARRTGEED